MKRVVDIIVKEVLLSEPRIHYPFIHDVAQFLAALSTELSGCVSMAHFYRPCCFPSPDPTSPAPSLLWLPSLVLLWGGFWISSVALAVCSRQAKWPPTGCWNQRKPQIKIPKFSFVKSSWLIERCETEKPHCHTFTNQTLGYVFQKFSGHREHIEKNLEEMKHKIKQVRFFSNI